VGHLDEEASDEALAEVAKFADKRLDLYAVPRPLFPTMRPHETGSATGSGCIHSRLSERP
jgi:hypothetical protein